MPEATLQDQVQDAPVWFVCLLILLSALAGEMYRVDKQHRLSRQLFVRIAIRAFAWCQHQENRDAH
ncbi:MAG: hypothetical protein Q7T36_00160 [Fluviicoccus sp.]|uniref:hypothetical protein n=1 Tax=Fluviicoccus sp. TaxID=2003552 RepID=UPI00271A41A4|nr:hypothetical protein [Fluviicoccus sp.]MDO8328870.1 hypothetical protein [Fluviicoccus sp.]